MHRRRENNSAIHNSALSASMVKSVTDGVGFSRQDPSSMESGSNSRISVRLASSLECLADTEEEPATALVGATVKLQSVVDANQEVWRSQPKADAG